MKVSVTEDINGMKYVRVTPDTEPKGEMSIAEYIDRTKLKEDSEYNSVSGEYLSYSRGQIWNTPTEKVIDISVLDKIRAEMFEEMLSHSGTGEEVIQAYADGLKKGLDILDKYKTEFEAKDKVSQG